MRLKIIAVFSLLVVVLGVLGWVVAGAVGSTPPDPQVAARALRGASAQFELEGAIARRWLFEQAAKTPSLQEPFGTPENLPDQRAGQAKSECDKIFAAAQADPDVAALKPSFIALVNTDGVSLGRNGSSARKEDFGKAYPAVKVALDPKTHATINDVWMDKSLGNQHLATLAPIVDKDGKVIGGIVMAWLLDNAHLSDVSAKISGQALVLAQKSANGITIAGSSDKADPALVAKLESGPAAEALSKTSGADVVDLPGFPAGSFATARGLEGYGEAGRNMMVVALVPAPPSVLMKLLLPFAGVTLFALVLVGIAGYLLGGYMMKPVTEIEEGLLGIINGQTNRRFEIEHAELGGVVSQLNSLLNQLFGVTEDDTDEEGRPSHAPDATAFKDAIMVDEKMTAAATSPGSSTVEAEALKSEPEEAYRARIFKEYIAAKRQVGDPTDHITKEDFIERIVKSEAEMAAEKGKPVRYKVEVKGKEVQLIAIPIG
jgi:hypothetical protein